MAASTVDRPLALPPAAPPTPRRALLLGATFAGAAVVMLLGALVGAFFAAQDAAETWPPEEVALPNVPLAVTYLTLAMSSVTAQWAVAAIGADDRRAMYVAIGLTVVLGAAFVNGVTFVWSMLGVAAGETSYADTMYALTGVHVLAVVAAIVVFVVMGFRALGGQFSARNREVVQVAAMFWHVVVALGALVWFFAFFLEGMPRG